MSRQGIRDQQGTGPATGAAGDEQAAHLDHAPGGKPQRPVIRIANSAELFPIKHDVKIVIITLVIFDIILQILKQSLFLSIFIT